MCTMIVASRVVGGPELFVIHNRDEQKSRRTGVPTIWERGGQKILAPEDKQAGGTWLGLNQQEVFAGITNRFGMISKEEHRSRGELVFLALEEASAGASVARLLGLSPTDYHGFHLLIGDRESAHVVWSDGEGFHHLRLEPGYYVLTERSFQAAMSRRLERMGTRLGTLGRWDQETRGRLMEWMKEKDRIAPFEGTCVDVPEIGYGTRSSTLVELGNPGARFLHAPGPPLEFGYQAYSTPRA